MVKIRPSVFAHYYHLQPGSLRVEVGQRVRTGQKLGLFGNSANTNGPHVHFGITDGRAALSSNSLPFEIDRFRFEGTPLRARRPASSRSPASRTESAGRIRSLPRSADNRAESGLAV